MSRTTKSPLKEAAFAVFSVAVLGVMPFFFGGYMLAGALGLVGHPGDFTATRCAMVSSGKSRQVECDGNLAVAYQPTRPAHLGTELPLGRTTPVRVLGAGPLETLGPAAVSGWSTVTVGGLTVLIAGGLLAFRKRLRQPVHHTVIRVLGVPAGLTLAGLVVYVVVELAG
ncbi:hypothetical protein [Streptomyces sp. NPDC046909]|uniref:hypothetical protein n=1 Tax=Streptomyces sp. NPDC046909 TaxID=3155617 RepID=UPI0033EF749A